METRIIGPRAKTFGLVRRRKPLYHRRGGSNFLAQCPIEGFRNAKLGIAISVTTVFIVATSELEK